MTEFPDPELQVLEFDQSVPPRPEEEVADAGLAPDGMRAERGERRA